MPVQASVVTIDLVVLPQQPGWPELHLGGIVEDLRWSEAQGSVSMALDATLPNLYLPEFGWLNQTLALGAKLELRADWGTGAGTISQFTVFRVRVQDDGIQRVLVTAYDALFAFLKSEDVLIKTTPTPVNAMVDQLLTAAGLPHPPITEPTTSIPMVHLSGLTRADLVNQLLQWGFERSPVEVKDPWYLQWRDGQAVVTKPGLNTTVYWLTIDNVGSFEDDWSIEDLVNEVYIYTPDLSRLPQDVGDLGISTIYGTTIPDPNRDYSTLVAPPGSAQTDASLLAQDIISATAGAEFQRTQKIARIQKVISTSTDNATLAVQQAVDILNISGLPHKIQRIDAPLLPMIRRGDAVLVTAGTMQEQIAICTEVEHDATARVSHLTFDSTGIMGRRVRRLHYYGTLGDAPFTLPEQQSLGASGLASGWSAAPQLLSTYGQPPAELVAAVQAIFPQWAWDAALVIAHSESGWSGTRILDTRNLAGGQCGVQITLNGKPALSEYSIGYFQINACAHGGDFDTWSDTQANVQKAYDLFHAAGDRWDGPWLYSAQALGLTGPARGLTEQAAQVTGIQASPSAPLPHASALSYNPQTPAVVQSGQWQCSCASTAWLLNSVGIAATQNDVVAWLGGDAAGDALPGGKVDANVGLHNHTGADLAALLSSIGLPAHYGALDFYGVQQHADHFPVLIGGVRWAGVGHWSGVRGSSGGTLLLANPAPSLGSTLTPAQFVSIGAGDGSVDAVWLGSTL